MNIFEVSSRLPNSYQFRGSGNSDVSPYNAGAGRRYPLSSAPSGIRHNRSSSVNSPSESNNSTVATPTIRYAHPLLDQQQNSVTNRMENLSEPVNNFNGNSSSDTPNLSINPRLNGGKYIARVVSNHTNGGNHLLSSQPAPKKSTIPHFSQKPSTDSVTPFSSSSEYIQLNNNKNTTESSSNFSSATVLPVFYQRESSKSSFPLIPSSNNSHNSHNSTRSDSTTPRTNLEIGPLMYRSNSALGTKIHHSNSINEYDSPPTSLSFKSGGNGNSTSDRLIKMYQSNLTNNYNSNFLFNANNGKTYKATSNSYDYPIKLTSKDYSVIKSIKARNDMLKVNNSNVPPPSSVNTYFPCKYDTTEPSICSSVNKMTGNLVMLQNKLDEQHERPYISDLTLSSNLLPENGKQKSILVNKKTQRYANGSNSAMYCNALSTPKKTVKFDLS